MNISLFYIKFFVLLVLIFFSGEMLIKGDWKLLYEQQAYLRCLPIEWTLIKEKKFVKSDVERGMLVELRTDNYAEFYKGNVKILKIIVGLPGDVIEMKEGKVYINDDYISVYKTKNGPFLPYKEFIFTLKEDEFWVAGSTPVALDSRYIGPVSLTDIIGEGFALF